MTVIKFDPKKTTLTPKQEEAITALGECLDVGEASKKTGIPAGTIRSWLQEILFLVAAEKAGYTTMNIYAKKHHLSPEQVKDFEKYLDDMSSRGKKAKE
jgi:hypothetical protein